jgi:hypothetical protein
MSFLLNGADKNKNSFDVRFKGVVHSIGSGKSMEGSPIKIIEVYDKRTLLLTLYWSIDLYDGLFEYMEPGDSIFLGDGDQKMNVMIKKNTNDFDGEKLKFFTD